MIFHVLFVDDDSEPRADIKAAADAFNKEGRSTTRLEVTSVASPEEMSTSLRKDCDLVLADVVFKDPDTGHPVNRLKGIIDLVREWEQTENVDRPVPIIAYTGWGRAELKACLAFRDDLYDIWDKGTASPDYVAWRLAGIASDLSRGRPDTTVQRYIKAMSSGCPWHESVTEMTKEYDSGWTERDQIIRSAGPILDIADTLGVRGACKTMWDVMYDWEFLSRAASETIRGHARHVINVFWLGYCLLNNQELETQWRELWKRLVGNRSGMADVDPNSLDGLNATWFYTGLFHDVGGGLEHYKDVVNKLQPVLDIAEACTKVAIVPAVIRTSRFDVEWESLHAELGDRWSALVPPPTANDVIDQGIAAAFCLRTRIAGTQSPFSREAARAAAVHNFVARMKSPPGISWRDEPIMNLLLLCDQLQTWDRERADDALKDEDWPHRAELRELTIDVRDHRPIVKMAIDYIAPRHVFRDPVTLKRLKRKLEDVLKEKPKPVLDALTDWPFDLEVVCSMNGDRISRPMVFGTRH